MCSTLWVPSPLQDPPAIDISIAGVFCVCNVSFLHKQFKAYLFPATDEFKN